MKYALISDFDGTITITDSFEYVAKKYLDKAALEPWKEYLAGTKTHFDAMKEIFVNIKIDKNEFEDFIKTIKVDEAFYKTFELCKQKSIPVYIVSAGCDYYIKVILGDLLNDITLITNPATYAKNTGLIISKLPKDNPYYDENVGVKKAIVVEELKNNGFYTIFAGDGRPDFEPAKIADTVFARAMLLDECKKHGISTKNFESYKDIYNYIKEL